MITATEIRSSQGFYTGKEVARIAQVPLNTVSNWRQKGLIVPTIDFIDEDGKNEKIYDYEALLLTRLLRILRENHVGLRRAVSTLRHCQSRFGPPGPAWAEIKVFVFDGEDVFTYRDDEWHSTVPTRAGQKAAEELFGAGFSKMRDRADALLIPNEFLWCVQIAPDIRGGLPVVRGTRAKTHTLREMVEANWTPQLIVSNAYPHLTEKQVECAVAYERFLDD